MKEKKDETALFVRPLNREKVLELISKSITLQEDEDINVYAFDALYDDNVIIDSDCCYGILNKVWLNNQIQYAFNVRAEIRTISKTPEGLRRWTTKETFLFPIGVTQELNICFGNPVSLKDFMGSRYNYNPRIKTNMRNFIEDANG